MLVVVDMQRMYPASEKVLPQVIKEIRKAKRRGEMICVLRYDSTSPTMRRVTNELKGVKHLTVTKCKDDGGAALLDALMDCTRNNNLSGQPKIELWKLKKLKICGVNTAACVMSTVETLSYLRWPVQVLSHACANDFDNKDKKQNQAYHDGALLLMDTWKNVEVV